MQHRTVEEVRRFDTGKLIVLLILIALLLLAWFRGCGQPQFVAEVPAAVATAVPEETPTDVPADVPDVDIPLPVIDPPDGPVSPGEVVLTGTGAPGREVAVLVDGEQAGMALVDGDGTWILPVELAAGEQQLVVQTLDERGAMLNESEPLAIDVFEQSPATIDVPDEQLEPGRVTLTGTAAPGTELEIVVNSEVVGTTTAGDDGTWSLAVELAEGENIVQAQTPDSQGVGISSEVVSLEVGGAEAAEQAESTILEAAETSGGFATFLEMVDAADLQETLDSETPLTIFAPTDAAFANMPQDVQDALLNMPQELLATVLEAHMVGGAYSAGDVAAARTLQTLSGDELAITRDETVTRVEGATLGSPAIEAGNGIIYPIDRVLLPSPLTPAGIQAPVIDDSGVPTFECCRLIVIGDAQPGTEIVLLANGEQFGTTVTVNQDGFWRVTGVVRIGDYDLVALMLGEEGELLGVSPRLFLAVTE
jgi:uncharacterized surface protein with fasciclin (FAS1) repeats